MSSIASNGGGRRMVDWWWYNSLAAEAVGLAFTIITGCQHIASLAMQLASPILAIVGMSVCPSVSLTHADTE